MEWFPGRVFAFFRRAAKEGRSRRSETSLVQIPVPAAAGSFPWGKLPPKVTDEGNPHHSGQSQPFSGFAARLCLSFPHPVASGGPLSLFRTKKEAKEMRQREPRRRTGEWPVSGFWPNTGHSPGSSSSNRNGSFRFEKDVSPESSSSDQRELRRIPANKDAAAAPLRSPGGYEGRETKVSGGREICSVIARPARRLVVAIRSLCPHVRTPSRHPAFLPFHERPAQGRFLFPRAGKFRCAAL